MTDQPTDISPAAPAELRLRARIAYDGTDFSGWARQPGLRTVAQVLEEALTTALHAPTPVHTVCAGRTDAGVHARDQHVHADVDAGVWQRACGGDPRRVRRRVNGLLPDDLRMLELRPAEPGFDARFSVVHRRYTYRISDLTEVDPLLRASVVGWPRPLDLDAMNDAAATLVGRHDFAAFCRHRPGSTTVRTLVELSWRRDDATRLAELTVVADAFCHSMVRSLVGVLLPVGEGRREVSWPGQVLMQGERRGDVTVAPARGLVLAEVTYADDLAAQARRSRRVRTLPTRHER
jgi:tRNA pseudouridine38-40 synthase